MTPRTRTLVLLVVLLLTLSDGATLVPGSEKGVTTPTPDVPAFDQSDGRIATDGDAFLAVWIDRAAANSGDVHGARISSDGRRIGDAVLPIAVTDADEAQVALAFGADRYLVVWSAGTVLRARFVERNGTMSEVFEIAPIASAGFHLQVAFNGDRFLVTWPMQTVFRGALLDANGALLKTFDIAPSAQTIYQPQTVAANGAFQFFSAITDFTRVPNDNGYPRDVGVIPIDGNGTVGARVVIAQPDTPVFDLRAVSSGTEVVVAWSTAVGIPGGTVRAVRMTSGGAGALETIPAEGMYLHDVAFDGGFFVIYGADSTKYMRRLGASTSTVMATPATPTAVLDVADNGARTLALIRGNARLGQDLGVAGADLYVTRLDTGDIDPVVVAPRHQSLPDVAAAGDLRLAVWCEYVGSERRLGIIGSRLNADGNALDPNGIDVHASVYRPSGPRVASNGTDWLVVWVDAAKLYGSRIAHDGTLIDTAPVQIATQIYADSDVAVSWDGTQYVVIFLRGDFFRGPRTTVRAARVPAQGAVTAMEVGLAEQSANELPAVASGPEGSLVVWRQGTTYLQGALLSRSGTVTPIGFPTIPTTSRLSVAWNHGTFLVASGFRGSFGDQIQWLLVSDTGVVRTPLSPFLDFSVGSGTGNSTIELEAHADGFLLFWNGSANDTVYAARINGDGILTDAPIAIGTTLGGYTPNFGATGNMVVYAHRIGHTTREIARVYTRQVQHTAGKPRRRAVR